MERFTWLCLCFIYGTLIPTNLNAQSTSTSNTPILGPNFVQKTLTDNHNTISLMVVFKDESARIRQQKEFPQANWVYHYLGTNAFQVEIKKEDLSDFVNQNVLFADYHTQIPEVELAVSFFDPRVNYIDRFQNQWGHLYTGEGLVCSVKEYRFDSLDIDLKGRYQSSGLASKQTTQHANAMASLIAGAGFSFYTAKGVATKANLSSSSFLQLLPDPDQILLNNQTSVQNHSYGIGVESYYGIEAAAYDRQAERLRHLLHIFSAGNMGQDSAQEGPYAGLEATANITGNFKQAKNVLVVGAVDSSQQEVALSAAGPAYDGRIKPEIVAFGEGGSSESAALVSGTALILQDIYQQQHNGALPSSAWTKAILCNSADDVGRFGPDYKTGFGNLNTFQASKDALSMRYVEDSIQSGQANSYYISLPPGTRNLKVMLVWTDPAAEPMNTQALRHDLELSLNHVDSTRTWLPWVLNSFPDLDSLHQLAKRAKDHLNPIEQISIVNPSAGAYQIRIQGLKVDSSWQKFALVWSWQEADHFEWLSPAKDGYFVAGASQSINWQSNLLAPQYDLEYRYCSSGSAWQSIAEDISLDDEHYQWRFPDTVALMQVRFVNSNHSLESDTFFCGRPIKLNLDVECEGEILLSWEEIPDISKYQLFAYDGTGLQLKGQYVNNYAWLEKTNAPERYFAVAPIMHNEKIGLRSSLLFLDFQSGACFIQQFFARLENQQIALDLKLGTTLEVLRVDWERKTVNGFELLATANLLPSPELAYVDMNPAEGVNIYRAKVILADGSSILSEEQLVLYVRQGRYLVAPNPVEWGFEIVVEGPIQDGSIFELVDTQGRVVISHALDLNYNQISTDQLTRGIYAYRIKNQGQVIEKAKLLIQ